MTTADDTNVLDFIASHRAARALSDKAEADFNAAADDDDTLEEAMLAAVGIERRLYDVMLSAKPSTIEGMTALIRYVDEVSGQQIERGHSDHSPEILMANLAA